MSSSSSRLFRAFLPILLIFIFVSCFSIIFSASLSNWHTDQSLVIGGNLVLFLVTLVSFLLYRKALLAANTHAFLRNVYSGMLLKLFVCIIAAFVYISMAGGDVNKPGLFILMFLYLVYTFLEIAIILRLSRQIKQRNNA